MASYTQTYNLPDAKKGDTFPGYAWEMEIDSSPMDLTGATVRMDFRFKRKNGAHGLTLSSPSRGLTITDNVISMDALKVNLEAGVWYWDLEITFSDGVVRTYVEGTWTIEQDATKNT